MDFYLRKNSNSKYLNLVDSYLQRNYCIEKILENNGEINMLSICLISQTNLYRELSKQNLLFNIISKRNFNEVSPEFEGIVKQLKFE